MIEVRAQTSHAEPGRYEVVIVTSSSGGTYMLGLPFTFETIERATEVADLIRPDAEADAKYKDDKVTAYLRGDR